MKVYLVLAILFFTFSLFIVFKPNVEKTGCTYERKFVPAVFTAYLFSQPYGLTDVFDQKLSQETRVCPVGTIKHYIPVDSLGIGTVFIGVYLFKKRKKKI